jgi:hypothetical protein
MRALSHSLSTKFFFQKSNPLLKGARGMFLGPLAFILGLFILLSPILLPAEEPAPVQIQVELGFGNLIVHGKPVHVRIDLSATKDFKGFLRVPCSGRGGRTHYEIPISIANNAKKRWTLTLPYMSRNSIHVQVLKDSDTLLSDQEFFGIAIEDDARLVAIVQETLAGRFAIRTNQDNDPLSSPFATRLRTSSLSSEFLPDNPLAYTSLQALIWRSDKPDALTQVQVEALSFWIKHGGTLIVAGGRTVPPPFLNQLSSVKQEDLSPFELGDLHQLTLSPSRYMTPRSDKSLTFSISDELSTKTIGIRSLDAPSDVIRLSSQSKNLCTEEAIGMGRIVHLAFDPQDLSHEGYHLNQDFWNTLIEKPKRNFHPLWQPLSKLAELSSDLNHTQLAIVADYRVASLTQVVSVFGVFVGLAFGLNFWLFRKSRKYEWAWLILVVSSITLFIYNRNFGRVGGFGLTQHVEIVKSYGVLGENSVMSFAEIGILSPRTRSDIISTIQPAQLLLGLDRQNRHILVDDHSQSFATRLSPGAFTTCALVGPDSFPLEKLEVRTEKVPEGLQVIIQNGTGFTLMNPQIQSPSAFVSELVSQTHTRGDTNSVLFRTNDKNLRQKEFLSRRNYSYQYSNADEKELIIRNDFSFEFQLDQSKTGLAKSNSQKFTIMRSFSLLLPLEIQTQIRETLEGKP